VSLPSHSLDVMRQGPSGFRLRVYLWACWARLRWRQAGARWSSGFGGCSRVDAVDFAPAGREGAVVVAAGGIDGVQGAAHPGGDEAGGAAEVEDAAGGCKIFCVSRAA